MRNLRPTWALLAFSIFLTFSACQKEEAFEPETELTLDDSKYQLEDLNKLDKIDISEATESKEFRISQTTDLERKRHALSFILPKLNLTEHQKKAVREFVEAHAECIKEHRQKLHDLHHELLKRANAARKEYIKAYKAGRISKAELEQKLQDLGARLREEINKNEQKQLHMRVLRKCRITLFSSIESVLTGEQLQKWNLWKESL